MELVPRSADGLLNDVRAVRENFPWVTMLNVPDLLRFPLRSWHACALGAEHYPSAVPHLRAVDFSPDAALPMIETLARANLNEVLVVTGDAPDDMRHETYPLSSLDLIARLKREVPHLKVYAALDPYRQSVRAEREYAKRKLDAGADGFFTQPFFDLRLVEIYAEMLRSVTVFWGASPVTTTGARAYWETRNNAFFPADFRPTLEWNATFGKSLLAFARENGFDAYVMPIKVDVRTYLSSLT